MNKPFKFKEQIKLQDGTLMDVYEDTDANACFGLESSHFEGGHSFYSPYANAPHMVDSTDDNLFDDNDEN